MYEKVKVMREALIWDKNPPEFETIFQSQGSSCNKNAWCTAKRNVSKENGSRMDNERMTWRACPLE